MPKPVTFNAPRKTLKNVTIQQGVEGHRATLILTFTDNTSCVLNFEPFISLSGYTERYDKKGNGKKLRNLDLAGGGKRTLAIGS